MVEAKLKWVGGRRFEGVSTWGFPIATDISKNSGGAESGYRPTELLMFALAGCTGVDVVNILEKMRQKITGVEVTVTGRQPESFPKPFNLDGKVSLVFGTHTHIPSADERILPLGTAFISDVGMTGPHNSVIGENPGLRVRKNIYQEAIRSDVAEAPPYEVNAALVEVDPETGRAISIRRLRQILDKLA